MSVHRFGFAILALLLAVPVMADSQKETDSPLTAAVRKKLRQAVSVEYKDTRLEDVVEDLKKQVENLSIWIDTAGGVSRNQTFTYQAADKPLAEVLDGLFKQTDLGYLIGKKKDRRYEGWLIIKKGKFRGDEEVTPARAPEKTIVKDKTKTENKASPAKPEDSADQAERDAARKLRLARMLERDGLVDKAKMRYQEIVDKYPHTKAGKEAHELLEKLAK